MRPSFKTLVATFVLGAALHDTANAEAPNQTAPVLKISGQVLSWDRVGRVSDYYLVKKVPGRAYSYSSVRGTSTTPSAVAGATVRYSVRTAVDGSLWARERSISYPAAGSAPSNAPTSPPPSGSFVAGVNAGAALDYELPYVRTLGARAARLQFPIGASVRDMAPVIGRYAQAEPLYLEAWAMQRRLLGEQHPDVAATLNNLAILHLHMNDFAGGADG